MLDRIKDKVQAFAGGQSEIAVDPQRMLFVDASNGCVDGACCLFFPPRGDQPVLVAKGARTETGKAIFRSEYETLETLHDLGMNKTYPTTPQPKGSWEDDQGLLITLQTAMPGELMKNIPGHALFGESLSETVGTVLDWWRRLHEAIGVQPITMDDPVYERDVATPIRLYLNRYRVDDGERRFLSDRFLDENRFAGHTLPYSVKHGDFVTANVTREAEGIGVFDWEFPLEPELPLFDVFFFFSSTRFPHVGSKRETPHFESFQEVFWKDNLLHRALLACLRDLGAAHRIPDELLADLFILTLVKTANMKYTSLTQTFGVEDDTSPDGEASGEEKDARWQALGNTDKDVPLARLRGGRFENLRYLAEKGPPNFL